MENNEEMTSEEIMEVKTSADIPDSPEGMRFLHELGKQSRDFKVVKIGERIFVNTSEGSLDEIIPYELPTPDQFETFTLSGLVKWLHEDVDKLFTRFERLFVHVISPTLVTVSTPGHGRRNERARLAFCEFNPPKIKFNEYMNQEDFMIHLQTRFQPTPEDFNEIATGGDAEAGDYAVVASLVGNIRMENEAQTADDGMSQRVTLKDGVSTVKEAIVKNPFTLYPFRTFEEVEQPASPFVLRIRKAQSGPEAALFEADGGVWKNEAVKRIGVYLEEALSDIPAVVIA